MKINIELGRHLDGEPIFIVDLHSEIGIYRSASEYEESNLPSLVEALTACINACLIHHKEKLLTKEQ